VIQENEIVMLLLGTGLFFFVWKNRSQLERIQGWKILESGFYILFTAWILTVLEGFFWKNLINYLEHICYALSSIILAAWCYKVFRKIKG
jgi:hypothetical protein